MEQSFNLYLIFDGTVFCLILNILDCIDNRGANNTAASYKNNPQFEDPTSLV